MAKTNLKIALKVASNGKQAAAKRVAALAQVPLQVNESNMSQVIAILVNAKEDLRVRLAALGAVQAGSFSALAFSPVRGEYLTALRKVAVDQNLELRQRALGMLAREKDGFAQKKLIDGLRDPEKALVTPEKALQLLAYDVHAEAYQVARAIVAQPPNAEAKREALRLLAADAKSAAMFETLLADKTAEPELRQLAAAALRATQPETLRRVARQVVMDAADNDDVQSTCLTALAQFGDAGFLCSGQ